MENGLQRGRPVRGAGDLERNGSPCPVWARQPSSLHFRTLQRSLESGFQLPCKLEGVGRPGARRSGCPGTLGENRTWGRRRLGAGWRGPWAPCSGMPQCRWAWNLERSISLACHMQHLDALSTASTLAHAVLPSAQLCVAAFWKAPFSPWPFAHAASSAWNHASFTHSQQEAASSPEVTLTASQVLSQECTSDKAPPWGSRSPLALHGLQLFMCRFLL